MVKKSRIEVSDMVGSDVVIISYVVVAMESVSGLEKEELIEMAVSL